MLIAYVSRRRTRFRSGKSTQCKLLVEHLNQQGIRAENMRFPDRTTTIGTMINSYLQNTVDTDDQSIHLLFSANRWECTKTIKDKLAQGITLVVDRYAFSGVAFSSAKGLDLAWCKSPDRGLPAPDVVFFLGE